MSQENKYEKVEEWCIKSIFIMGTITLLITMLFLCGVVINIAIEHWFKL